MTARRVAAQRLTFARVPAPYGDPASDERLSRDVGKDAGGPGRGMLTRYLEARTSFFDRVVVRWLEDHDQVVVVGAGYDGRSLRYAKPGTRWFEVDHPATQADKTQRLARLGIPAVHVTFVAADLGVDDLDAALGSAGHDSSSPTLFVFEGVAVYLPEIVLERTLRAMRGRASAGSILAASMSVETTDPEAAFRRRRFQRAVGALGEPARNFLTSEGAAAMLAAAGWRDAGRVSEPARRAGFLLLAPAGDQQE